MAGSGERRRFAIDRDMCIGSGNCVFYAGATFDLDAENLAMIIDPLRNDEAAQRMAVDNCPTGALSFLDGEAG